MKTKDYTNTTGKIKPFHLEDEVANMVTVGSKKPSSRLIKTKKGKRAIAGLIDIEKNHNHSWYQELKNRAEKNPDALALFYRGTKISFREMFQKANCVASSLRAIGIQPGDEIPAFLSNTPETVYILLAVNMLGAKINLMSPTLDKEYIASILETCSHKVLFATDDEYPQVKDVIDNFDCKNIIMSSLADSLPEDPTKCDEYEPTLDKYYHYDNNVGKYKEQDSRINSFVDFEKYGEEHYEEIEPVGDLTTEFLITYTSGSTRTGYPKQLVHTNRSLIVSGRFHDSELSGNPDLKGLRGMAHIHTDSNTNIITCISDNLMQLWSVALEPEYGLDTALDVIFLNKPNYMNMTTSHLIQAAKDFMLGHKFHENGKGRKMPWLFACFAVGEAASPGEEKFLNRWLRTIKAGSGVKINGLALPYTTLCVGGGDCEHGGIYYTLWKALFDKFNYLKLKQHVTGMIPEAYVQTSAFRKRLDGTYEECDFGEYGIIASNSATTMSHYKDNPEKTQELIITDTLGRDWVSNNVYGYIDELGGVHVKGRVGKVIQIADDYAVPPYVIEDMVCQDTKNVLSCTVNTTEDDNTVINIQFQPNKKYSDRYVIESFLKRFKKEYNIDLSKSVLFRIIDIRESFPLTGSGKRSIPKLEQMNVENTMVYNNVTDSLEVNIPDNVKRVVLK